MKAQELIEKLSVLIKEHGNLPVYGYDDSELLNESEIEKVVFIEEYKDETISKSLPQRIKVY